MDWTTAGSKNVYMSPCSSSSAHQRWRFDGSLLKTDSNSAWDDPGEWCLDWTTAESKNVYMSPCSSSSAHQRWQMDASNACTDLDNGATDTGSDPCSWYVQNNQACGNYDDSDFSSNTMCCTCGGGSSPDVPPSLYGTGHCTGATETYRSSMWELAEHCQQVESVRPIYDRLQLARAAPAQVLRFAPPAGFSQGCSAHSPWEGEPAKC